MTPDAPPTPALRLLFAKNELGYPRSSGHDIRAYNMMRAMEQLGHHVGLLTVVEPKPQALDGLRLAWRGRWAANVPVTSPTPPLPSMQARYASYFGATDDLMLAVAAAVRQFDADALIGIGPDMPPYMARAAT